MNFKLVSFHLSEERHWLPDSSSQIRLREARFEDTRGDIVRLFLWNQLEISFLKGWWELKVKIRLREARFDETSGDIVRLFLFFSWNQFLEGVGERFKKTISHLKRESVMDFRLTDEKRAVATSELGSNSTLTIALYVVRQIFSCWNIEFIKMKLHQIWGSVWSYCPLFILLVLIVDTDHGVDLNVIKVYLK